MNVVFWLLVIAALALLWLCLSFAFKGIGGLGERLWNRMKKEIADDESENIKEKKEIDKSEKG